MSGEPEDDQDGPAASGYGRPPQATRFKKGQSGNPRGRPRGRRREIPHDRILGQMVTIRESGRERRVTAAEAFLLRLAQQGLAGDSAAARASLAAIESARAKRIPQETTRITRIVFVGMGVGMAIGDLGIGFKRFPRDKDRVRWELNPWIVEAALKRLGERQLAKEEQQEVWNNTRTPENVAWPKWWTVRG
jgi:hypothetical protein